MGLKLALRRYDERGAFGAWLRTITARTALMRARASRRRENVALLEARDTAAPSGDFALSMTIERSLAALPSALRKVFVLRSWKATPMRRSATP